ncbi:MAG: HD domain-containing protein [Nitrospirota bacterium]
MKDEAILSFYNGVALMADPLYGYIQFTTPISKHEVTEKELIDSPWVQRLRYIYQLQSARWVYPSAEHSRFQHSIGAMHLAGRFARHLYPSLKEVVRECPSEFYVEEILRLAALLHDIGHGPFGHFFDENFLEDLSLNHEIIGQRIIEDEIGDLIRLIRRSPGGWFSEDEEIHPEQISFLIRKGEGDTRRQPRWLVLLQPLLGGIYTIDNLDYVLRDSYMCGVSIGPVDIERLMHYTFFTKKGLTLHRAGGAALGMFLNARLYLYSNVYYHRTTRAIDLHLREIFRDTMSIIFPYSPVDRLDRYLYLTDWSLLEEVRRWDRSSNMAKGKLGKEWKRILCRDIKWKMAYETTLSTSVIEKGKRMISAGDLEREIKKRLSPELKSLPFRVDMASQDPRPINPLVMGEKQIYVYNPSDGSSSKEPLKEYFDYIPAKVVKCRIFTINHKHDATITSIAESILQSEDESINTNV